jgi:hypothetical protein
MTEKQFEEFLKDAIKDYNNPPETPKDAMWARIEEVRRVRREAPKVVILKSQWLRWGVGVAAALALGIGIGMNLDQARQAADAPEVIATEGQSVQAVDQPDVQLLAAMGHLNRAEAFLTMFQADVRSGRSDYQSANPARELLTMTRLLQGSAAAQETQLRELLDDLELVLMQIAQLRSEVNGQETDLVTQAMDERSVLLRLRAAAEIGPVLRGVQGAL